MNAPKQWNPTEARLCLQVAEQKGIPFCARRFACTEADVHALIAAHKQTPPPPAQAAVQADPALQLDAVETLWASILTSYNKQGDYMRLLTELLARNLEADEIEEELNAMFRKDFATKGPASISDVSAAFHEKFIAIPRAKLQVLQDDAAPKQA